MAHLLKRLELNGFKSFAGRTVLEFTSGITAIVGPNGSGKSNVVDAIRWLLGERDAKNLRGGKIDDLIFAGTAKRPRMGQAQASLHFENHNHFFPVDFEEVSVMRQVSRDGASQYYLNKSEILLRDLVDFFAKARLGSKGLIVVTQGNSDMFIRATPKERREMIEEILGLREYQLKKADAERKLKNSRINLDKVKALVEEILPHLRSLKRQTNRWAKRGELEDELTTLENQYFGPQLNEADAALARLESELAVHKEQRGHLEKERHGAESHQREVEAMQPKEREEAAKIKEQIQGLIEKRSVLQKDLGRFEAQIEFAKRAQKSTTIETEKVLALVHDLRERLSRALDGDMIEMKAVIEDAVQAIDDVLRVGKSGVEIDKTLVANLERISNELEALGREMLVLREKEKYFEKSQEEFYGAFKKAVAAVQAAKEELEKWESVEQRMRFEKQRHELRKEELERQIVQMGRRVEEFRGLRAEAHPEGFAAVERRILKLRGDLASIGEVDTALMKEAQETETRYEFLTRESEDLKNAIGDLVSLIDDLNEKLRTEFEKALVKINGEFQTFFELMFGGGIAKLKVKKEKKEEPVAEGEDAPQGEKKEEEMPHTEEEMQEEAGGIEIDIKLPRKKIDALEVLSGGEKSLVGIAALFALISVSPPPFLVLDEIDAPLDERNARRFADMLKEFSKKTQFVIVTHNRATMEAADVLYGVTLNEDGTSKIISLKLEAA